MKSVLFALLFFLVPKLCISQVITEYDKVSYLDADFRLGTKDNHRYFEVIKEYLLPGRKTYSVEVYYKSGKIQMRGTTTNRDVIRKTGNFVYYYENGNKKRIINYMDDKEVGDFFEFYENGKMKYAAEKVLVKDKPNERVVINRQSIRSVSYPAQDKIKSYWNEKGEQLVTDGFGYMDSEEGKGKLVNYVKDSIWTGYLKGINLSYIEKYDNGTFISGVSIDSNKVEKQYTVLESKPYPKKGMEHFYEFIGRNYKTPNMQGLKGKVYVSFVVEKEGVLGDFIILRDIGYDTGEEAIRVIKNYGAWVPGEQRGQKVRCHFGLPISIQSTYERNYEQENGLNNFSPQTTARRHYNSSLNKY